MCSGVRTVKQLTDADLIQKAIDKVATVCERRQIQCDEELLSAMTECFLAGMSFEAHLASERIARGFSR